MIIELAAIVLMVATAAVVAMKLTAASDRPDRALIGWAAGSLLLAGAMEWASHRASRRNDDLQILLVPRVLREGDLFPRLFPRLERTWREEVEDSFSFPIPDLRRSLEESGRNAAPLLRMIFPGVAAIVQVSCAARVVSGLVKTSPSPSWSLALAVGAAGVTTVVFWVAWRDLRLGQRRTLPRLRAESWAHGYQPDRPVMLIPAAPAFVLEFAPLLVVAVGWTYSSSWHVHLAAMVASIMLAQMLWRGRARVDGSAIRCCEARTVRLSSLIARIWGAQRLVQRIRQVVGVLALASFGASMAGPGAPYSVTATGTSLAAAFLALYMLCWFMLYEERPSRPVRPVSAAEWLRDVIGPAGEQRVTETLNSLTSVAVVLGVVLAFL